ncbi:MAG TPA: hypothetical protein VFE78_14515 [Gemmataceae bacterium]|jgi:uncharacterized tellurite resistance protein B-like protein|nr:hypothetical protein [Gemmataceae bacterium]
MPQRKLEDSPPETLRMEIFKALVDAQDQEMSVARSRKLVAERFGISESQLKEIEEEGLDRQWEPL